MHTWPQVWLAQHEVPYYYLLLTTHHHSPLTTHHSPLTTHHSLQVWLAQHSVPHLVELVCEPVMQSRTHLMDMIRRLLENLSSNSANRRRLYPAELVHLEDRVRPLRIGLGLGL